MLPQLLLISHACSFTFALTICTTFAVQDFLHISSQLNAGQKWLYYGHRPPFLVTSDYVVQIVSIITGLCATMILSSSCNIPEGAILVLERILQAALECQMVARVALDIQNILYVYAADFFEDKGWLVWLPRTVFTIGICCSIIFNSIKNELKEVWSAGVLICLFIPLACMVKPLSKRYAMAKWGGAVRPPSPTWYLCLALLYTLSSSVNLAGGTIILSVSFSPSVTKDIGRTIGSGMFLMSNIMQQTVSICWYTLHLWKKETIDLTSFKELEARKPLGERIALSSRSITRSFSTEADVSVVDVVVR